MKNNLNIKISKLKNIKIFKLIKIKSQQKNEN